MKMCRLSTISLSQRTILRRILSCCGSLVVLAALLSLAFSFEIVLFKSQTHQGQNIQQQNSEGGANCIRKSSLLKVVPLAYQVYTQGIILGMFIKIEIACYYH